MIVSLIDSGLGLLPTAAILRRIDPTLDLLLQVDPEGAPWGPKPADWVIERVLAAGRYAVDQGARAVVLPCNTASVTALAELRAELEPEVPVVGTVPAIKPAAAQHDQIAIWATEATSRSAYQANLIAEFAGSATVASIACPGLADAIDRGDESAWRIAVKDAARRTPADVTAVVLGCTHYPLVSEVIVESLERSVEMYDSAEAVAAQVIRRLSEVADSTDRGTGEVRVVRNGKPGELPASAGMFAAGRALLSTN